MGDKRLTYLDLKDAKSIKTFQNEVFMLKGTLAANEENGKIERLADVYYRVRTAVGKDNKIMAKRKTPLDELVEVHSQRKIK